MTITHITPRETALERENERLLSTVRFQAEAIELIRSELAKVQPVQEPVAYEFRMRAEWVKDWGLWSPCSKEQHEMYIRAPKLHDWLYETRALYSEPVQPAPQPVQDAAMKWLDKLKPTKGEIYIKGNALPESDHETATGRALYTVTALRKAYDAGFEDATGKLGYCVCVDGVHIPDDVVKKAVFLYMTRDMK